LFVQVNVAPAGVLTKFVSGTTEPLQTDKELIAFTVICGLTLTVKLLVGPLQPFKVAVTVIVAVILVALILVAENVPIFPLPLLGKPIAVLEFVQVKVEPANDAVNGANETASPGQTRTFAGTVTVGFGLIVIV
jgi:hypothetical protein